MYQALPLLGNIESFKGRTNSVTLKTRDHIRFNRSTKLPVVTNETNASISTRSIISSNNGPRIGFGQNTPSLTPAEYFAQAVHLFMNRIPLFLEGLSSRLQRLVQMNYELVPQAALRIGAAFIEQFHTPSRDKCDTLAKNRLLLLQLGVRNFQP